MLYHQFPQVVLALRQFVGPCFWFGQVFEGTLTVSHVPAMKSASDWADVIIAEVCLPLRLLPLDNALS